MPSPPDPSPYETPPAGDEGSPAEHRGGIVRRVFGHRSSPEERLEQLLAERRRELAEQAAIVEQTLADLEEREQRLRDSKAAIERVLRLGQRDLDLRESDLVRLGRELEERGSRVEDEAAELTRRRAELGAVELKRAALEQRDRALTAREAEIEDRQARLDERVPREAPRDVAESPAAAEPAEPVERKLAGPIEPPEPAGAAAPPAVTAPGGPPALFFVPGPSYRLVETSGPLESGATVELEGATYVVARVGPSPLPGDTRRCAYLVLGGPRLSASSGSS